MFSSLKKILFPHKLSFPPDTAALWDHASKVRINALIDEYSRFLTNGVDGRGVADGVQFRPSLGSTEEHRAALILGAVHFTLFKYESAEALDEHLQSVSASYMMLGWKPAREDLKDLNSQVTSSRLSVDEFSGWYAKLCLDVGAEDTLRERARLRDLRREGASQRGGSQEPTIALMRELIAEDMAWIEQRGRQASLPNVPPHMAQVVEMRRGRMQARINRLSDLEGGAQATTEQEAG